MENRTVIIFKINERVIFQAPENTSIEEQELIRGSISKRFGCRLSEIDIEYIVERTDLSLLYVNGNGALHFGDLPNYTIQGIRLNTQITKENINNFLDKLVDNSIDDYFTFTI